jgi:cell wall-associated NlpC family hydrolase
MKPEHHQKSIDVPADPAAREIPVAAARVHRGGWLCHRIGLTAALLAGAGSIVLGADLVHAAPAAAAPAARSGHGGPPGGGAAIHQGWDGSVYWFRNEAGQWHYTRHHDLYLDRISHRRPVPEVPTVPRAPGTAAAPGAATAAKAPQPSGPPKAPQPAQAPQPAPGAQASQAAQTPGPPKAADPPKPDAAPDAHHPVETAVAFALAQLGKPYVWGGNGPDGFDCSGLVQQAFRRAGVSLPRVASDQYAATTPVRANQLRRGDLLFWSSDGSTRGIHHIALYLGDGTYVEAPKAGTRIRIHKLNRGYWPTQMSRP